MLHILLTAYIYIYLYTYLITLWSRVLLEKLTGSQLVKKSPHFMEPEGSLPHSHVYIYIYIYAYKLLYSYIYMNINYEACNYI